MSGLKRQPVGGCVLCHPCDDIFTVEVLKACAVQTYPIQQVTDKFWCAWAPKMTWKSLSSLMKKRVLVLEWYNVVILLKFI